MIRPLLLGLVLLGAAVTAGANTDAANGRYWVTIDFTAAADRDALVQELLSSCGCGQDAFTQRSADGIIVIATPAAAELLSRDARVRSVEALSSGDNPSFVSAAPYPAPADADDALTAAVSLAPSPSLTPATDATVFWSRAYTYDGSGNVASAGSDRYAYDHLGRVTYADAGAGRKQQYTYDRYGNLSTIREDGASTPDTLHVDPVTNRLQPVNLIAQYDLAGRMTQMTGASMKYDANDTVTESTVAGQRRIHLYSARDERIATLLVDNAGQELSSAWTIRDPSGKILRRLSRRPGTTPWTWEEDFIYRDGQLLASEIATSARTLHFHLDHLGTPRVITGSGGALVAQHTYYAFGKEATDPTQDSEALKFTAHERDAAYLDYMHARYYNPVWGRFLSVDPVLGDPRSPQTWNRYAYVTNNPANAVDPSGLTPIVVTAPGPDATTADVYKTMFFMSWEFAKQLARAAARSVGSEYQRAIHAFGYAGRALEPDCGDDEACAELFMSISGAGVYGKGSGATAIARVVWGVTRVGTDRVVKHQTFGKIYRHKSSHLWWSKDNAGHAGSAWKVFAETPKGLKHVADADEFGNFITGKHKGPVGKFLPWSDLSGADF